jgi:rhodanese-related sulfurtransferase
MQTLTIIESIINCFDVGIIFESLNNARKRRFNMDMMEFLKQLFWGKGYDNIIPPQLSEKIKKSGDDILVIDLREKEQFEKSNIEAAISNPFDDFLKSVLVDQKYADYLDKEIILVCDTGHMSRVAGAILAEEGYKKIYSLSRGMRRWNRWQKILTQCSRLKYEKNSLLASIC